MLRHHEAAFQGRIDELAERGVTFLKWWEIYLWFGAQRVGRTIWREIRQRFEEAEEQRGARTGQPVIQGKLRIYQAEELDGFYLIHPLGLWVLGDGDDLQRADPEWEPLQTADESRQSPSNGG